jgi:putative addiction module component (TIGR02574 family)
MATTIDISKLTVEERLQLMDEIWDSLSNKPEAFPLTAAQEAELDRRLDEIDQGDDSGIPLEDFVQKIRNKKR